MTPHRSHSLPWPGAILALLCLLPAARGAAGDELIVDEHFKNQTRTGQNPPHSLAWYASHAGYASNRGRNLRVLTRVEGPRQVAAHFPRVTLETGDLLTFDFEFEPGAPPGDDNAGFRFGLFDSAGEKRNRFTTDARDPSVTSRGYAVLMNLRNSRDMASLALCKREGRASLIGEARHYRDNLSPRVLIPGRIFPNRRYHVEMTIARTGARMAEIAFELSGGGMEKAFSYKITTDAASVFSFDTIGFGTSSAGASDVYFYDIVVTREKQSAGR
ncbi:MAG: hypothetical protein LBC18_02710 [Opitutaceae bacterium]|jgi:hypothetical protein|nr:hypothetical protein [Opitutaceae bacterium]